MKIELDNGNGDIVLFVQMGIDSDVRVFPVNIGPKARLSGKAVADGVLHPHGAVLGISDKLIAAVEIHGDGGLIVKIFLIAETVGAIVKIDVISGIEGTQSQKHSGGKPGFQTDPDAGLRISGKADAGDGLLDIGGSQSGKLLPEQGFQPPGTGCKIIQHRSNLVLSPCIISKRPGRENSGRRE